MAQGAEHLHSLHLHLYENNFWNWLAGNWNMGELEFEQQAFVELLSEDGLIILARLV